MNASMFKYLNQLKFVVKIFYMNFSNPRFHIVVSNLSHGVQKSEESQGALGEPFKKYLADFFR